MIESVALLNEESEKLTADELTKMVGHTGVKATGFFDHTKATERYVILSVADGASAKEWYLPYYYRRTNVRIDTTTELVSYIKEVCGLLSKKRVDAYKKAIQKIIKQLFGKNASVTLPIFKKLLDNCGEWVWNKKFISSNPQRRIQDLKEMGFTIATKMEDKKTYHMLMPFDMVTAPTYETIPPKVRKAIFEALGGVDAYHGAPTTLARVLPDHKFPEIRWEVGVEESNEGLSTLDMQIKFQLIPEWVNQAKREVCRKCFQKGIRGTLNGIDFYYHGDKKWPANVPTTGTVAKVGCLGCFWYDMMEWRKQLNKIIADHK